MAPEHLEVVVEVAERLALAYQRKRDRSRAAASKKRQEKRAAPVEQVPAASPDQPVPAASPDKSAPAASVEAPAPTPEAVHTLAANLVEALEISAPGLEPPQLVRQHTRAPAPRKPPEPKKVAPAAKPSGVAQALVASGKQRLFA